MLPEGPKVHSVVWRDGMFGHSARVFGGTGACPESEYTLTTGAGVAVHASLVCISKLTAEVFVPMYLQIFRNKSDKERGKEEEESSRFANHVAHHLTHFCSSWHSWLAWPNQNH